MNIVETAAGHTAFSTLLTVLKPADLTSALAATGSLAVFAWCSETFAKFPVGSADDLVKSANKYKLTAILKLHGVPGAHMASEQVGRTSDVATPGGEMVHVSVKDGSVLASRCRLWQHGRTLATETIP